MAPENHPQQFIDEIQAQLRSQVAHLQRPTVLVCGYTGTGKTSLIRAICGPDTVAADRIHHGRCGTTDFDFYENPLVRFWDSMGFEPGQKEEAFLQRTQAFFRKLQDDPDVENHVHLVWYCIAGCNARVTASDKRLLRDIFANVLVLITKNDITSEKQRQALRQELLDSGVAPGRILFCSEEDASSLKEVVRVSSALLPDAFREAWVAAQLVDLGLKQTRAQTIIHLAAVAAAGIGGGNPLPISDALLITPTQIGMIVGLALLYGFPEDAVKAGMLPVVTETAGIMTASSLTKLFPGVGGFIQASVASLITEALGQLCNQFLIACVEARLHGRPAPTFPLALDHLGPLLQKLRKRSPSSSQ